jgi:hypothetical protein
MIVCFGLAGRTRAYPLLMESKAASKFLFFVRLYRKTASHFSGRTLSALPLILSFSHREKGRLNIARSVQHRPLSLWERDRVRGNAL